MTAKIKLRTIAVLLTVILICSCLPVIVPYKAFADSTIVSNEYVGKEVTVSD